MDKNNKHILTLAKASLEEALRRVDIALDDIETNKWYSEFQSATFASAKRGALDCKRELTKLTQSSKYKYGR